MHPKLTSMLKISKKKFNSSETAHKIVSQKQFHVSYFIMS